jgi:hypothetical protein
MREVSRGASAFLVVAALTSAIAGLGPVWAASATTAPAIVVGKSIDGVTVNETEQAVGAALGKADYTKCGESVPNGSFGFIDCDKKAHVTHWYYSERQLSVAFRSGKVVDVATTLPAARDSDGVGPGSTLSQVQKARPNGFGGVGYEVYYTPKAKSMKVGNRYTEWKLTYGAPSARRDPVEFVIIGVYAAQQSLTCDWGCGA